MKPINFQVLFDSVVQVKFYWIYKKKSCSLLDNINHSALFRFVISAIFTLFRYTPKEMRRWSRIRLWAHFILYTALAFTFTLYPATIHMQYFFVAKCKQKWALLLLINTQRVLRETDASMRFDDCLQFALMIATSTKQYRAIAN